MARFSLIRIWLGEFGDDADLVVCVLVENVGAGSKYAVPIAKRVFDSYYNNNMKEYYSQKTDIESTQTNQ